ncbi:MAG: hypothetical protein KF789_05370 [Bdellovibrionaceae bacterium]|nr:hypothetical protein [Pseudobdellovibrionaceae bacterium]
MRFFGLILLIGLQAGLAMAQGASVEASFREFEGKTFEVVGPNCFGTALRLSGFQTTFRGVDGGEFQAFVKLACRKVQNPEPGDIGIFEMRGFAMAHAYIYLSPELGIDKPGVDYLGKTPIAVKPLASIIYRNLASPECRRYSKDISECSSDHYYVRCAGLPESQSQRLQDHDRKVLALENLMASLLEVAVFAPEQAAAVVEMSERLAELREDLRGPLVSEISGDMRSYLTARIASLEKQIEYFKIKVAASLR